MSRYLPDNNLSYPVLIKIGTSSGSGFIFDDNSWIYLVTAKHVLFKQDGNQISSSLHLIMYGENLSIDVPAEFDLDFNLLISTSSVRKHPSADVVVIKIAKLETSPTGMMAHWINGVVQTRNPGSSIVGVRQDTVKKFNDVLISNEAIILGYPNSLGEISSGQIDYSRPLLRKGIIAGKNKRTKTIILDCPVYFGNSGSLALEIEHLEDGLRKASAIGVVVELVPFIEKVISNAYGTTNQNIENSGYSVVIPMDIILEITGI